MSHLKQWLCELADCPHLSVSESGDCTVCGDPVAKLTRTSAKTVPLWLKVAAVFGFLTVSAALVNLVWGFGELWGAW